MALATLVFLLLIQAASGQDSSSFSQPPLNEPSQIQVELFRGLDVDWWQSTLHFKSELSRGIRFNLQDRYKIVLHRSTGYFRQWKHDHRLGFKIDRDLTEKTSFGLAGSLESYYDESARAFPTNDLFEPSTPYQLRMLELETSVIRSEEDAQSAAYFIGGGSYSPDKSITLEGMAGPVQVHQGSDYKTGARLTASARGKIIPAQVGFSTNGWRDHYGRDADQGLECSIQGQWGDLRSAQDQFDARYSISDRHEYGLKSDSQPHRRDGALQLRNSIQTSLERSWTFSWESDLLRQAADYIGTNNQFYELIWKNNLRLTWKSGDWIGKTLGGVDMQEQEFSGGLSQGRRTWLGAGVQWIGIVADSLGLESSAARYRFDTPDTADHNDRDELQYRISVIGIWTITSALRLQVTGETNLLHLVYLYRDRSGENRWVRRFRLSTELPWQEESFHNLARISVSSAFSDYDYEPAKNDQSRIYRAYNLTDSLTVRLSSTVGWSSNFSWLADDHGRLRWEDWIQLLSERGRSLSLSSMAGWRNSQYSLSGGWMWLHRLSHVYDENHNSTIGEDVAADGPVWVVSLDQSSRLAGEFRGRVLRFKDRKRGDQVVPDVMMNLIWKLE